MKTVIVDQAIADTLRALVIDCGGVPFDAQIGFPLCDIEMNGCVRECIDGEEMIHGGEEAEEADFFSLYIHTFDKDYAVKMGPTYCIADFPDEMDHDEVENIGEYIAGELGVIFSNLS
ncbi:hypothetical protein [Desulfovibrio ferrophilus]|nr:hypothetical protein [Desulfovibrio ferrophilus]